MGKRSKRCRSNRNGEETTRNQQCKGRFFVASSRGERGVGDRERPASLVAPPLSDMPGCFHATRSAIRLRTRKTLIVEWSFTSGPEKSRILRRIKAIVGEGE